jgi:hypothetical protein
MKNLNINASGDKNESQNNQNHNDLLRPSGLRYKNEIKFHGL